MNSYIFVPLDYYNTLVSMKKGVKNQAEEKSEHGKLETGSNVSSSENSNFDMKKYRKSKFAAFLKAADQHEELKKFPNLHELIHQALGMSRKKLK